MGGRQGAEKTRHKETAEQKAHVQKLAATAAEIKVLTGRTTLSMTHSSLRVTVHPLTSNGASLMIQPGWDEALVVV